MSHYFLGLSVPEHIRKELSDVNNLPLQSFRQITHRADYHITLFFLGAVQEKTRLALMSRMKDLALHFPPFKVRLGAAGLFGRESSPSVLWAGVESSPPLNELQAGVADQCAHEGFQKENRKYRPHITIAKRWKSEEPFSLVNVRTETEVWHRLSWQVEQFILYRIHPRDTPRYEELARFEFGGTSR